MAFFQNSVLNKYLEYNDKLKVDKAFEKLKIYQAKADHIKSFREEQYQTDFLNDVFVDVFGFKSKYKTPEDFNLVREEKNESDSKKADGAIVNDGKIVGVIELKGVDTKDLSKVADQAFGYKVNHQNCIYVITSNFEKLRFYINDKVDFLEFNLFQIKRGEFEILWLCLASENLLSDLPLKLKQESVVNDELITKKLYKDYSWPTNKDNRQEFMAS